MSLMVFDGFPWFSVDFLSEARFPAQSRKPSSTVGHVLSIAVNDSNGGEQWVPEG